MRGRLGVRGGVGCVSVGGGDGSEVPPHTPHRFSKTREHLGYEI